MGEPAGGGVAGGEVETFCGGDVAGGVEDAEKIVAAAREAEAEGALANKEEEMARRGLGMWRRRGIGQIRQLRCGGWRSLGGRELSEALAAERLAAAKKEAENLI